MRQEIEKIEVSKENGSFYYTGILKTDLDDPEWVVISTTRGEKLKFRKEQIQQRRLVEVSEINKKKVYNKGL